MATFRARFTVISTTGDFVIDGSGTYRIIKGQGFVTGSLSGTVTYAISALDGFSFDGGMTWGPAPAGFLADGSTLQFLNTFADVVLSGAALPAAISPASWSGTITATWGNFSNSPVTRTLVIQTPPTNTNAQDLDIVDTATFVPGPLTDTDLIEQLTISASVSGQSFVGAINSQARTSVANPLQIEGDYTALGFTYSFPQNGDSVEANTPDDDSNNGTLITITSDPGDPNALLLDQLVISTTCGTLQVVTQTANLLTFYIPAACNGAGAVLIQATGNGTQFSGTVTLGTLTILTTNGSGIYVLTPGATHDTLYSSLRDGTTRNVKIPNPFFKTGYIGG